MAVSAGDGLCPASLRDPWRGPHTVSGPRPTGRARAPSAAGLLTLGLGGGRRASRHQSGASWPGHQRPFGSPDGCGTDGNVRAADTPPAQPGASPGWKGVDAGSPPSARGPLVSG